MEPRVGTQASAVSRAQIRVMALVATGMTWVGVLIWNERAGIAVSDALANASAAAIVGLSTWVVYHVVSGQNNGIVMFVVGMSVFGLRGRSTPLGPTFGFVIPFALAVGGLAGLLARALSGISRRRIVSRTSSSVTSDQHERSD